MSFLAVGVNNLVKFKFEVLNYPWGKTPPQGKDALPEEVARQGITCPAGWGVNPNYYLLQFIVFFCAAELGIIMFV